MGGHSAHPEVDVNGRGILRVQKGGHAAGQAVVAQVQRMGHHNARKELGNGILRKPRIPERASKVSYTLAHSCSSN